MIDDLKLSKREDICNFFEEIQKVAQTEYKPQDYKTCFAKARKWLNFVVHGNASATGLLVLSLYLKQNKHYSNVANASISTTVSGLATLRGVDRRTMYRHLLVLRKCKFISAYTRLGLGITISINTDILLCNRSESPIIVPVLQEPINNNSDKDKDKDPGGQVSSVVENPCSHASEIPKERLLSLSNFWEGFKQNFYAGQNFDDWEELEIKNLIREGLFNNFKLHPIYKDWGEFEKVTLERVKILKKHLRKAKNERFIVHPLIYFDPDNQTCGFAATYTWYLRQQLLKVKIKTLKKQDEKPIYTYLKARTHVNKFTNWQLEEEYIKYKPALQGAYKTASYHA